MSSQHNDEIINNDIRRMQKYYDLRAPEYEAMYGFDNPQRRAELDAIEALARKTFKNQRVLEVACGSGYWTEILSTVATSVTAVDTSKAMLEIAGARSYANDNVTLEVCDAYNLNTLAREFDAALAGFWLSHIPKRQMDVFLAGLHSCLSTGAPVLFFDNNLVAGLGGTIVEPADSSDTFKKRTLADGSTHVITKNYFTVQELKALLTPYADTIQITMGKWYWSALCQSR